MRDKIRVVRGMVEEQSTQDDVLRSGKVDTIISEPIGVMLLHERMVRVVLGGALTPGGIVHPRSRHVSQARRADASVSWARVLRSVHG